MTENLEEEQLEQYINEILLNTISILKTGNQQDEEIENKIIPSHIDSLSVQISKQHKATGLGIIYGKDGKTAINLDKKCPPIPYCESFEANYIPQTVILVYPARFLIHTRNESGERIPEVFADDEVTRRDFFVDIITILLIQMVLTFTFIFACEYISILEDFLKADRIFYICFLVVDVILFILLIIFEAVRKTSPWNYLVIAVFTFCSTYLLGLSHAVMGTHKVLLLSFGGTLLILIVVGILAWTNCYDFTTWGYIINSSIIIGFIFFIVALVYFKVTGSNFLIYIFSCAYIIFICFTLLHQFQLLLGEGKYALETDEEILAAVTLYIETIVIYTIFPILLKGSQK